MKQNDHEQINSCKTKLLLGPYRTGKTKHIIRELIEHKKQAPLAKTLVVVPSARYARLLKECLVAELSTKATSLVATGIFGVTIIPFYRACQWVSEEAGYTHGFLPRELRTSVINSVIREMHESGKIKQLASVINLKGTGGALLKIIDQFQRSGLLPDTISDRVNKSPYKENIHLELAAIYQAYCQRLESINCLDQKQQVFLACKNLANPDNKLNIDTLVIDGFDRINTLQAKFFQSLAQHSKRSLITFDFQFAEYTSNDLAVLQQQLEENNISSTYAWKKNSVAHLLALEPQVVYIQAQAKESKPAREYFSALDRFSEMREIARACKQDLLQNKVAGHQILVAVRSIQTYSSAARAAFAEAGIPYTIDESIELKTLPFINLFRQLLRLHLDNFGRAKVINCLRSPFLNQKSLGLTAEMVNQIDQLSRKYMIIETEKQWQEYFNRENNLEIKKALRQFFQLTTPPAKAATTSNYCLWLEKLLLELLIDHDLSSETSISVMKTDLVSSLRHLLAVFIFNEQKLEKGKLTYEQFVEQIESLLDTSTLPSPAVGDDSVLICGADMVPNRYFQNIYIAGMIEGEFPKHSGQRGFLNSEQTLFWEKLGVEMREPREEPGFELALFDSLVERASSKICFSYPKFNLDGEDQTPSNYLEAAGIYFNSFIRSTENPVSARDALTGYIWQYPTKQFPDLLNRNTAIFNCIEKINEPIAAARLRFSTRENHYNGFLVPDMQAGTLSVAMPDTWSASKLNNYGKCPFKFWVSNVLNLEVPEEPEFGMSAKVKGSLYHKVLELYHKALIAKCQQDNICQSNVDLESKYILLESAFADASKMIERSYSLKPTEFSHFEQKDLLFRLKRLIKNEDKALEAEGDKFVPVKLEVPFGKANDESFPPLVIDTNKGPIKIAGVIDRMDLPISIAAQYNNLQPHQNMQASEPVRVKLIDYKSSTLDTGLDDALSGRNLQLPIYALAAQESIFPNSTATSGIYMNVNTGKPAKYFAFTSGKTTELLSITKAHISRFIDNISSGNFLIAPSDTKVCKTCDHQSACRILELSQEYNQEGEE